MKGLQRDQESAWKTRHQEQLDEALAGAHGAVVAQLALLDRLELNSAQRYSPSFCTSTGAPSATMSRPTVLHQLYPTIVRLRERNGLPPLDILFPGQPDNVFRRVKQMLFAPPPTG